MSKAQKKTSRLTRALLETADDMRRGGLIVSDVLRPLAVRRWS